MVDQNRQSYSRTGQAEKDYVRENAYILTSMMEDVVGE